MSMQRYTAFNKTTGKFLRSGAQQDLSGLASAGHIITEGNYDKTKMWDFATSTVVDDSQYISDKANYEQRKTDLSARREQHRADLTAIKDTITTLPEAIAAIKKLIEMDERA